MIILTMMGSAVVFPPLIGGAAPVPEKVSCAIADRQAFQQPEGVHLTGWIGSRIDVNEKNRLVMMDPNRLLISYRKRPGGAGVGWRACRQMVACRHAGLGVHRRP
jgi:hypothetical protein